MNVLHKITLTPCAVAALLCACSEQPSDAELGYAFVPLELSAESEALEAPLTLTASLRVTRELDGLRVRPRGYELQELTEGGAALLSLLLPASKDTRAIFRGPFDPREFNQVVVRYRANGKQVLSVGLYSAGEEVLRSESRRVLDMESSQPLVFELHGTRLLEEPIDEVRLHVNSHVTRGHLFGVDLLKRAEGSMLPAPGAPALVEIGLESRLAIGLQEGSPVRAGVILPPDATLAFGFGQPRGIGVEGSGASLLQVTIEQGDLVRRYELALGAGSGWNSISLSLTGFADRYANFEFALSPSSGENLIALEVPIVFHAQENPPTTLLITSDTHRADHIGVGGSEPGLRTPFLDELALGGVYFETAYASSNATIPSHVALMTATHPRDTQIVTNQAQLSQSAETLAECYRKAGYATYCSVSAGHLSQARSGLGQGFERSARPAEMVQDAQQSIDILEAWLPGAEGRPLFLWLHLFDAHHPYAPPVEFDGLYWESGRDPFDPTREAYTIAAPAVIDRAFPRDLRGLRDIEYPHAQYMAEITYLDAQLGRLLGLPRLAGAQVAMTADHGESFGAHGVWFGHGGLYPQTIQVPLILAGPSIPAGQRVQRPVTQLDLGRTLLDLSGLQATPFPGRNLLDVPESEMTVPIFALAAFGSEASVTSDGYHLVLHLAGRVSDGMARVTTRCTTELYSLADDPDCMTDLWGSAEHAQHGRELRSALTEWLGQARPTGWAMHPGALTETDLDELAKLGYASGPVEPAPAVWFADCDDE